MADSWDSDGDLWFRTDDNDFSDEPRMIYINQQWGQFWLSIPWKTGSTPFNTLRQAKKAGDKIADLRRTPSQNGRLAARIEPRLQRDRQDYLG